MQSVADTFSSITMDQYHTQFQQQAQTGLYIPIWRQLRLLNTKIRRISHKVCPSYNELQGPELRQFQDGNREFISMFSSTLESLSIDAYIRRTLSTKLTNIIDYSPCLTELYISAFGITLKLDEVLASFPALKTIGIQHSDLRLGKNFPECPTNHGLTKIIAISVWTDVRTHNRLSLQCRQSNYLCFKGVRVEGSVCPTTGRISIDIAYTIGLVALSVRSPKALQILDSKDHDNSRSQKEEEEDDNDNDNDESREWIWFHIQHTTRDPFSGYIVRQLEQDESQEVMEYFANYKLQKEQESNPPDRRIDFQLSPVRKWEYALRLGYALFKCGSIAE
ncbi:hypothetical protein F4703DRAFT_1797625 [Phycomyces blakesleeanus]